VIGALSRFTSLFVINRGSTFSYKGRAATAAQVSKDLGVRYIVEGTLRKSGNRVRITVQLVDAINNASLFSEQFEGVLDDVFALQDQITQKIVAAVAPGIERLELRRAERAALTEVDTWLVYQNGLSAYYEQVEEKFVEAIGYFDEVNRLNPKFAPAFAWGALVRMALASTYRGAELDVLSHVAMEKAELAYVLDPADPLALLAAARIQTGLGNHELAVAQVSKAVEANPNSAYARRRLGYALLVGGRYEAALELFDKALLLSPLDPAESMIKGHKAYAHFALGEYDIGLHAVRSANSPKRMNVMVRCVEPLILLKLGRQEEARPAMARIRADFPKLSIASGYAGLKHLAPSLRDPIIAGLRELGVQEE
jgi:adenylate cyclase